MAIKSKLLLITAVGLVLSACSVHINTSIKPDGSGVFSVEFVVNDIDIAFIEAEEDETIEEIMLREFDTTDKQAACELLAENGDFPLPVTTKYQEKNRNYICEISMPFANLDELVEIYDDMFYGMTGNVHMDESGELTYALNVETDDFETAEDLGVPQIEYLWSVSVPGNIELHNADKKRGSFLTWELQPESFRSVEVISVPQTNFGTSFDVLPNIGLLGIAVLACFCIVGIIIVGGIAFFLIRRR